MLRTLIAAMAILSLTGCSLDVIPVHYSRVKSARDASKPLARGPNAPGAFKQSLTFASASGIVFDPSQIEISAGAARLKARSGPEKYATGKVTLESSHGIPYAALDAFAEVTSADHRGELRYQLSPNSSSWYFHDGKAWTLAGPSPSQANTASEVNARIVDFHSALGPGNLYVKIFFVSPAGRESVSLERIDVSGILPKTDGWD